MRIGVLSERHSLEDRVCLTPAAARILTQDGHRVMLESGAGGAARFPDEEYQNAGAWIVHDREELFDRSDLLIKVLPLKESEIEFLSDGQTVLAFHHLAASSREVVEELMRRGVTVIGNEVIEDRRGSLPVLHAMSEIAGQLAVHVGAHHLETRGGGRGILLGGATGIPPAHVVILGAGVVGRWAARVALGNGAQVTCLDTDFEALRHLQRHAGPGVVTQVADAANIERAAGFADVLIGAVLVKGERSPHVVTRSMVQRMKPGAVIVDISIDQGGCVETSRPTTLEYPTYIEEDVTHFAVSNITSAVARTASYALSHALAPFVRELAGQGIEAALCRHSGLAAGTYLYRGELVFKAVGELFDMEWRSLDTLADRSRP